MVVYNNGKTVAFREKAALIIWFYALRFKKLEMKMLILLPVQWNKWA